MEWIFLGFCCFCKKWFIDIGRNEVWLVGYGIVLDYVLNFYECFVWFVFGWGYGCVYVCRGGGVRLFFGIFSFDVLLVIGGFGWGSMFFVIGCGCGVVFFGGCVEIY